MQALRDLMRLLLRRDGHEVVCVADGNSALSRILGDPAGFDVVITDHHMADTNGTAVVEQLRRWRYKGRIIVFSSELSLDVRDAYVGLGVDAILYKPVLPEELREILRRFLA